MFIKPESDPEVESPWIETCPSGGKFSFMKPDASQVHIEDIAHSLSIQERFTGHSKFHWSVAAHSILVYDYVKQFYPDNHDLLLGALLHDGHEAYDGDVSRPLKLYFSYFTKVMKELSEKIQGIIVEKFNILLSESEEQIIKNSDMEVLMLEASVLLPTKGKDWTWPRGCKPAGIISPSIDIKEYHPSSIESLFLEKFNMYS